ncbi:hypothetical protein LU604_12575 [Erwinia tracheiphila]|uniref:hypothetical protein n=1 Tax=Erwinia tracheiphila TaxID=65700 RepID=UPI001F384404|nr:hypothetical protein [Erwinia tracheiphila]UIA85450.1 hypothetical protein LU604_12060 [Erwinia tracheiphila]UIA85517.1 hypothetical protein LU604_12575 [Erwinia tracheiphila]UIA93970.1 hypothetical protein LU632_11630 [Erwinia tracheiphila]UIA94038.1 hypothetical protein LU632_12140 [Erwinia tracheiphila]
MLSGVVSGNPPKFCGILEEKNLIGGDAAAAKVSEPVHRFVSLPDFDMFNPASKAG